MQIYTIFFILLAIVRKNNDFLMVYCGFDLEMSR